MKYPSYTRAVHKYDLQGELDESLKGLRKLTNDIECDDVVGNRKEILKGMINYLVEQL
tara:strand:- start:44 stop:217 length:174 start_codon:yes stop_codon:yes gene_type:complete